MKQSTNFWNEFTDTMAIPGPDEVYLLGVASFYHFALEEMIIIKLSIGWVMCVNINLRNVFCWHSCLFSVLYAAHVIVVLKNVIERGILIYENVDGLITHKLHLLSQLFSHLRSWHPNDLTALTFPCSHTIMEVSAHRYLLQLHIHLTQQIISCYLFISITQKPTFS